MSAIVQQHTMSNNDAGSLDDDEKTDRMLWIKHINANKCYAIPCKYATISKKLQYIIDNNNADDTYGFVENNPIIVENTVNMDVFEFIIKYIMLSESKESASPEKPLKNVDMSVILGPEYVLFTSIYDSDTPLSSQLESLNNYIMGALYFEFQYLHEKICAIISSFFKGKPLEEVKAMLNDNTPTPEL